MKKNSIILGSRASKLALVQAEMAKAQLLAAFPGLRVEIATFTTSGDKHQEGLISDIGNKGLFTKEIEEALLAGTVDIAVHSAKDMATWLPEGLIIAGCLARADARDALVCPHAATIQALPQDAVFGTSSLRRSAQALRLRPDLKIIPLRGNVPSRLKKIEQGEPQATLLAMAGLNRLGIKTGIIHPLAMEEMLPAVAQGIIALECRAADEDMQHAIATINHLSSQYTLVCERAFLEALDGSCRTPIAGHATINGNNLHLRAMIIKPDGSVVHTTERQGNVNDAMALGKDAGEELKSTGGANFFSL